MKKIKLLICLLMILCLMSSTVVSANPVLKDVSSSNHNYESNIVSLFTSKDEINFKHNGYVETIEVYGVLKDGTTVNINSFVKILSQDELVATVYNGSIRAEGAGSTSILITYEDLSLTVKVSVEDYYDLNELESQILNELDAANIDHDISENPNFYITPRRSVQTILDKAVAMKNLQWTPTKDLVGWNGLITFKKGVVQTGIPYSQNVQCDDISFVTALSNSNFYTNVSDDNKNNMPRYGVDCSGYVSFALGVTRHNSDGFVAAIGGDLFNKVGSYEVNTYDKTKYQNAYTLMVAGDAMAWSGHAILVVSNSVSSKEVVVYETVNKYPVLSIYTYDTLLIKQAKPFRLK